jgi:hypothetical protein
MRPYDCCLGNLSDLHRTELVDDDARIHSGHYAPVIVWEDGRRVMKPMRYQCRPAGKPAFYDVKYPGTYNARRDNLEGFWKELFGLSHGVVVMNAFFENVNLHRAQVAICATMKRFKTSFSNSDRVRRKTCLWRASGRSGFQQRVKSCCPLQRLPTTRRRRLKRQDMNDVSCRPRKRT